MIINSIKPINDKYMVVYFDDGFLFKAKNSEINRLGLQVDMDVDDDLYERIYNEFGIRRCRFKAVDILSKSDKTVKELSRKLLDSFFAQSVVESVIKQLMELHYIDDERVASNYIELNMSKKSRKAIKLKLTEKGVDSQLIDNLLDELYDGDSELNIARKYLRKYSDITFFDDIKNRKKVYAALYNKGIGNKTITQAIEEKIRKLEESF